MTATHATIDFETRSEAGYFWDEEGGTWRGPPGSRAKGLQAVGTARYFEHPTTDILTLSYSLPWGVRGRWKPGEPHPVILFAYVQSGGLVEAHNAFFEWCAWALCVQRYEFPRMGPYQMRCSMAKARVAGFPGALADLSDVLELPTPKDKEGKRLLDKFSVPQKPTKKDPRRWHLPEQEPVEFERLRAYCDTDVIAEEQASERLPDMSPDELIFWMVDQEINRRGIAVDRKGIRDCIAVLDQALEQYGEECRAITGGLKPSQVQALVGWLRAKGVHIGSLDEEAVTEALTWPHVTGEARRVLELRALAGSASVKKLYAMENEACSDDRLRNLIIHHGARTGRPTGGGPQPLNLPRDGPAVKWCKPCGKPFAPAHAWCPWCGEAAPEKVGKWMPPAVDVALEVMAARNLALVEWYFGDALLTISGCLRGLFVAAPGHDLIASDYSAIEAVVTAMLAGEQWRIDAFRRGDPIYLLGASKITGVSVEEYLTYHANSHPDPKQRFHHPDRQNIGKVSELAGGFGGWIGAWKAFGSTEPDEVIKAQILAWRRASPAIVEFWGGQFRGSPWDANQRQEYYGVEGAAIQAVLYPDMQFEFRGLRFFMRDKALIIRLLSGRELTYNDARVTPATRPHSRPGELTLTYMTWNSNPKYGAMGWVPMATYGGRLTENIVQATAHDILRHAIMLCRSRGYQTVLHVYDELICEIPQGTGSIEEFEHLMSTMPEWAKDWPIVASGGWRGRRYRKEG